MMKFFLNALLIFILFSCYTSQDQLEKLTKINENINIALKITVYIRNTEIDPDMIYIENLRTFKIYKLGKGNNKYFYINNIPAGQYRVGFFICSYKVNKVEFKTFFYSNNIYNISKSGSYLLGNHFYQYAVNSSKLSPIKLKIKEINSPLKEFSDYVSINSVKSTPIEKTHIYRNCEYGNIYPIHIENYNIEQDILNLVEKEKSIIQSYFKIIDREISQHGFDKKVLDLILGYYIITLNINILIKKALLYYKLNQIDQSLEILEELIKIDPNIPEYYSILGEIEFKNENFKNAKLFLYRAISNQSSIIDSYDLYANLLIKEGDYKDAKIFSDYSLQVDPNNLKYLKTNLEIYKKLDNKKIIDKLEKRYKDLTNGR